MKPKSDLKTFDFVLQTMGYKGTSMGERLENIKPGQFAKLDELWSAHKVRNDIVDNIDYHFIRDDAEKTMETFRDILKSLEII